VVARERVALVIGLVVLLVVVACFYLRYRAKRRLVAGLDRPAIWREPAAGRLVRNRKGERL
jgi:hypothetical protein